MVNSVINEVVIGMATKINKIYNKKYPIHTDSEEQGLDKPCFLLNI